MWFPLLLIPLGISCPGEQFQLFRSHFGKFESQLAQGKAVGLVVPQLSSLCYLPVTVILKNKTNKRKPSWARQLREDKGLFGFPVPDGLLWPTWQGGRATPTGTGARTANCTLINHKHEAERPKRKWHEALNSQCPSSSGFTSSPKAAPPKPQTCHQQGSRCPNTRVYGGMFLIQTTALTQVSFHRLRVESDGFLGKYVII